MKSVRKYLCLYNVSISCKIHILSVKALFEITKMQNKSPVNSVIEIDWAFVYGAENGSRTRRLLLGKQPLYRMSYPRVEYRIIIAQH